MGQDVKTSEPAPARKAQALYRTRLSPFIQRAFTIVDPGSAYLHNWHIDAIAEYLEACTRKDIQRLIINMPPRYLKSIAVSVAWPAWLIGRKPSERILAVSYAHKLSLKHSMDCRLIIRSNWYRDLFPKVQLADDQDTQEKFITTERGQRYATSFGGTATGDGGNFIIVDDPTNPQQAQSVKERENANEWFDQTLSNRLDNKKTGVIVVVMQRLHQNDLTGHLLDKGGWEHLCLPGVAEVKTIVDFGRVKVTREQGSLLHEAREGAKEIQRQKVEMGSYGFAAQYQQRPTPIEGGMIKADWFKRYEHKRESYSRVIQSWDTAVKPGQIHDPSVCTTWGEHEHGFDLLQVVVRRLEYPDLKRLVVSQCQAFGADAVLIEDKASGQQLIQDLKLEKDPIMPIIGITPTADKITRLSAVSALIEAGKVFLPVNAPWLADYEAEMLHFPNGTHDDQVDSTSQLLDYTKKRSSPNPRIRSL